MTAKYIQPKSRPGLWLLLLLFGAAIAALLILPREGESPRRFVERVWQEARGVTAPPAEGESKPSPGGTPASTAADTVAVATGSVTLAAEGKSQFVIVHAPEAPETVREAAAELQHYLEKSTGARLPVVTSEPAEGAPAIYLGDGPWAVRAGINAADLPWEASRTLVRDGSVFIVGRDTADGTRTPQGGISAGTRNGVYFFLEEAAGIRWLLPGEDGEVVPEHGKLKVAAMDRTDAPAFERRVLPYSGKGEEVVRWRQRQRLGGSLEIYHGHHWKEAVPPELFAQHPDWFPLRGGDRVPPAGRYKIETTNPGLIAHYAQQAIEAFDRNPKLYSFSLSPSDSGGWSESPEALALQEKDPHGGRSVTPLVLKFYNDVARLVAEKHPDKVLPGYIYAEYLYPPAGGVPPMEPNLFPVVAPHISYGFTLYRDDIRQDWLGIMDAWAQASSHLGYYDLMNWWMQEIGAVMPVAVPIVRFVFENLREYPVVESVFLYGRSAWGSGGASNYILARLMWDPSLDPEALRREYFTQAYGPQAAVPLLAMDDLLDAAFAREYRENDQARYIPTPEMLRRIYRGENFASLRRLYTEAAAATMTEPQRRRLEMLGLNFSVLEWNLVSRGMLAADPASPFHRTSEEVFAAMSDPANLIALGEFRGTISEQAPPPTEVRLPETGIERPLRMDRSHAYRGDLLAVLYPLSDDQIEITPRIVNDQGAMLTYTAQNALGEIFGRGIFNNGEKVVLFGRAREPLFLTVHGPGTYSLEITGAPYAVRSLRKYETTRLHFQGRTTPLYVHVPAETTAWTFQINTDSPGETAAARIIDPKGQTVAEISTAETTTVRQELPNTPEGGFWTVEFVPPASGVVDDVRIELDGVSSWFVTDPALALIAERKDSADPDTDKEGAKR